MGLFFFPQNHPQTIREIPLSFSFGCGVFFVLTFTVAFTVVVVVIWDFWRGKFSLLRRDMFHEHF